MKLLTARQAAYIAGLVDGEGYIGLVSQNRGRGWYYPRVTVANTNRDLLTWLNVATGIKADHTHAHDPAKGWKAYGQWICPTEHISAFLNAIKDDLVIKYDQATILLEYMEKCHAPRGSALSEDNRTLRSIIFDELEAMNRKGL